MDHCKEVSRLTFPARDDAAEVVKPGEEPLDLPPSSFTAKRAAVLCLRPTMGAVRGDEFDVVRRGEMLIQPIAVVGAIPDQSGRKRLDEACGERGVDELDFMRRSAGHVDGDRKTVAVANRHDFAALTASSRADGGAPFFAELKLASMKHSLRSSFPRSRRSSASRCNSRSNRPLRCQC